MSRFLESFFFKKKRLSNWGGIADGWEGWVWSGDTRNEKNSGWGSDSTERRIWLVIQSMCSLRRMQISRQLATSLSLKLILCAYSIRGEDLKSDGSNEAGQIREQFASGSPKHFQTCLTRGCWSGAESWLCFHKRGEEKGGRIHDGWLFRPLCPKNSSQSGQAARVTNSRVNGSTGNHNLNIISMIFLRRKRQLPTIYNHTRYATKNNSDIDGI